MKKILILLCIIPFLLFSQSNPKIKYKNVQIDIDGQLNESIWQNLEEFPTFRNHFPIDTGFAKNSTKVKAFNDGSYLYIGAIYHDTTPQNNISSLKRDNYFQGFHLSDCFGVILDPYNNKNNGYFFAVNAGGTQYDALISNNNNRNDSWNSIWYSQVSIKGNNKIYEIAIPFEALNFDSENTTWGIQLYTNDKKINLYTTLTKSPRNYLQQDLRFLSEVDIQNISQQSSVGLTLIPSTSLSYQKDLKANSKETTFTPSLDAQYNLTSALRLDATINPDFSQIEVDQQVVNLTRFAVNFPEKRNFFLENSDLFSNLGTNTVNPFYSRRIGSKSDIKFGIKLSGNIAKNTRIGVLDVQTKGNNNFISQNHAVVVGQQKLNNNFTAVGFLVNRQQANNFTFSNDYNRVAGLDLTYKSANNKWTGLANYGKSFTTGLNGKNNNFNIEAEYDSPELDGMLSFTSVEKNFITDLGFVPRLYNYDAANNRVIRSTYYESFASISLYHFPENSETIDSYRYLNLKNATYWDEKGNITEVSNFFNNAFWFKNLSSVFINVYHDYNNLKYSFDPIQSGNPITPGKYNSFSVMVGFNSSTNKKMYYNFHSRFGSYFTGSYFRNYINLGIKMLPFAHIKTEYEINHIDLNVLGKETFHLVNLIGEVFFSNKLNWTTYLQYNTQRNNFNINSRLQWEYNPLSHIYLVVTNNYNKQIVAKSWGVALKVNYILTL